MVALATVTACSVQVHPRYYKDDRRAAEAAMQTFHERLGKGEFEDIYDDASEALHAAAPKEALLAGMRQTREQYGKYVRAEVKAAACSPEEIRLAP
jgi:hypothetical protein